MRFRIDPNVTEWVDLDELPGGRDLYLMLTDVFLDAFEGTTWRTGHCYIHDQDVPCGECPGSVVK